MAILSFFLYLLAPHCKERFPSLCIHLSVYQLLSAETHGIKFYLISFNTFLLFEPRGVLSCWLLDPCDISHFSVLTSGTTDILGSSWIFYYLPCLGINHLSKGLWFISVGDASPPTPPFDALSQSLSRLISLCQLLHAGIFKFLL